jgi:hypothetical protein
LLVCSTADGCFGGHSGGETPGYIPNPVAKPSSADGTALGRVWESRTPPDSTLERPTPHGVGLSVFPKLLATPARGKRAGSGRAGGRRAGLTRLSARRVWASSGPACPSRRPSERVSSRTRRRRRHPPAMMYFLSFRSTGLPVRGSASPAVRAHLPGLGSFQRRKASSVPPGPGIPAGRHLLRHRCPRQPCHGSRPPARGRLLSSACLRERTAGPWERRSRVRGKCGCAALAVPAKGVEGI